MAICTDQGSNMAGPESGLGKLLQSEFPHILAVNDLSHIYNLICKKAVPTFPKMIVEMVKYITSYFKRSNKKKAAFEKFQKVAKILLKFFLFQKFVGYLLPNVWKEF